MTAENRFHFLESLLGMLGIDKNIHLARTRVVPVGSIVRREIFDQKILDRHERVVPQPGDFYGGWITADVVGPFKGEPGTAGW